MAGRGPLDHPTPQAHTARRGNEEHTHLLLSICAHFFKFNQLKSQGMPTKRTRIPSLPLAHQVSYHSIPNHNMEGGQGVVARHSGGVFAVLMFGLLPLTPHP